MEERASENVSWHCNFVSFAFALIKKIKDSHMCLYLSQHYRT